MQPIFSLNQLVLMIYGKSLKIYNNRFQIFQLVMNFPSQHSETFKLNLISWQPLRNIRRQAPMKKKVDSAELTSRVGPGLLTAQSQLLFYYGREKSLIG